MGLERGSEGKSCHESNFQQPPRNAEPGTRADHRSEAAFAAKKQVWAIRARLELAGYLRDLTLFNVAIDSKLRGCDLVKIRIGDVAAGGEIRRRATVIQQKTGRPVQFEITQTARESLSGWLQVRGGALEDFVFPSRLRRCPHIGTRQHARLVSEWVEAIGLPPEEYGTHSLRRTKASLIHKKTGNLRAVQILLGLSLIHI